MKKSPVHWTSKIPVPYKCNAITGELRRAKKIASSFDIEIKCVAAGFLFRLICSISFLKTFFSKLFFTIEKCKFNLV